MKKLLNNYLMLWFDINGEWFGCTCKHKDVEAGAVAVKMKNGKKEKRDIRTCGYVSKFSFSKDRKDLIRWDERNILFDRYPELESVSV